MGISKLRYSITNANNANHRSAEYLREYYDRLFRSNIEEGHNNLFRRGG